MRRSLARWILLGLIAAHGAYAACTSPNAVAGARNYFTTGHTYKFCNGSSWDAFNVSGTAGGCSTEGRMDYDGSLTSYKFCNGTNWQVVKCAPSSTTTAVYLVNTATTSWTVPIDWNSSNNTVEIIGGGGNGSGRQSSSIGGTGGGGGEYVKRSNVSLTPGTTGYFGIANGSSAGDSYFNPINLIVQSTSLTNVIWGTNQASRTGNATTAPDGTTTALSFQNGTLSANYAAFFEAAGSWGNPGIVANQNYTLSIYAKKNLTNYLYIYFQSSPTNAAGQVFNLSNGTLGESHTISGGVLVSATITTDSLATGSGGNGWYRCNLTASMPTTTSAYYNVELAPLATGNTYSNVGDLDQTASANTEGVYVWGPSVVPASQALSYISTTSAAAYSALAKGGTTGTTSAAGVHQTGGQGDVVYEGGDGFKPGTGVAIGGGGGGAAGPLGWGQTATTSAGGNAEDLNLYSSSQAVGSWNLVNVSVTPSATTAPDGTLSAQKIFEDSSNNLHRLWESISKPASSQPFTFTMYAKAAQRRLVINIDDNVGNGVTVTYDLTGAQVGLAGTTYGTGVSLVSATLGTDSIATGNSGNGWYRIAIEFTSNTATTMYTFLSLDNGTGTGAQSTVYTGDGSSGVYVWGPQLNYGNLNPLKSYVSTTSAGLWVLSGGAQGASGNNGTDYDASHGAGSGAGGRSGNGAGFGAGAYGAGGSGSGTQNGQSGGNGWQGLIVIKYVPTCNTLGSCSTAGRVESFSGNALGYCDGTSWRVMAQ